MIQQMKQEIRGIKLSKLCGLLGVTRQAYYQHIDRIEWTKIEHELVLRQVKKIRMDHRYMGTRKLYEMLQPFLMEHQIKIGRDALNDLLSDHKLLVRRRKRTTKTTHSYHRFRKWPNLVVTFEPAAANHLWVSDITYWRTKSGFIYISLITDAYSHKIVGWQVEDSLKTAGPLAALKKAILGSLGGPNHLCELIHHSDRGFQYCSSRYVKLLQKNNIKISMTQRGDPTDNPVAERVNGIIKNEYLCDYTISSLKQARTILDRTIKLYNSERPHLSLGMHTPNKIHSNKNIQPINLWKNKLCIAILGINNCCQLIAGLS